MFNPNTSCAYNVKITHICVILGIVYNCIYIYIIEHYVSYARHVYTHIYIYNNNYKYTIIIMMMISLYV